MFLLKRGGLSHQCLYVFLSRDMAIDLTHDRPFLKWQRPEIFDAWKGYMAIVTNVALKVDLSVPKTGGQPLEIIYDR